jgi:hypothetical protein
MKTFGILYALALGAAAVPLEQEVRDWRDVAAGSGEPVGGELRMFWMIGISWRSIREAEARRVF